MAALKATRSAQWALVGSVTFDISLGDTMANTTAVVVAIGAVAGAQAFDAIKLPKGARVIGGQITVVTVGNDSGAQTMSVGDSGSVTRYLGATSIKAAARTALVPTGYTGTGEDIRLTFSNNTGDATTGKVVVDVEYVIDGKADNSIPN